MVNKKTSFWTSLVGKNKEQITNLLITKLGTPDNDLNNNLLQEISKKINSYYAPETQQSHTTYSLFGYVSEIQEKKFKEGKRKGQTFYVLKLGEPKKETLQACQENLIPEKWQQIKKLAILGQNLVFKYQKWITNKQLLDFQKQ